MIKNQPKNYFVLKLYFQNTRTVAQLRLNNKYILKFILNGISYIITTRKICTACNKNDNEPNSTFFLLCHV